MNKEQIIKKIYSSLPKSIDAYNIKQYILGFLFLRYIDASKYRKICEFKENIIKKLEEYINEIHNIEEYKGLLSGIDLHHEQLGATEQLRNKNIYNIMSAVLLFDIFDNTDIFGDIYEYLMFQYDSQAGSFGGEFFTPPEVAQLLANICTHERTVQSVYDPTCGSGSLLLKVKAAKYYGQEFNIVTYKLAKINLILHNIKTSDFNIAHGDTLSSPAQLKNTDEVIDIEEVEKAIQECEQKIADNKKVIDAFVNSYKTADTLDDIIKAMELAKNE